MTTKTRKRAVKSDPAPEPVEAEVLPPPPPPANDEPPPYKPQSYLYVVYVVGDIRHKAILLPDILEPTETRHMQELLSMVRREEGGEAPVTIIFFKRLFGGLAS